MYVLNKLTSGGIFIMTVSFCAASLWIVLIVPENKATVTIKTISRKTTVHILSRHWAKKNNKKTKHRMEKNVCFLAQLNRCSWLHWLIMACFWEEAIMYFCVENHNMSRLAHKQREYDGLFCQRVVASKTMGISTVNKFAHSLCPCPPAVPSAF